MHAVSLVGQLIDEYSACVPAVQPQIWSCVTLIQAHAMHYRELRCLVNCKRPFLWLDPHNSCFYDLFLLSQSHISTGLCRLESTLKIVGSLSSIMSTNTTSSTDPSVVALTTFFTPATTCTGLTFSSPSYSIWYNEPVPLPSVTETGCYPSQWLNGYTSLSTSSVAVALNPLVCPQGWTTAYNTTSSYLACCPT